MDLADIVQALPITANAEQTRYVFRLAAIEEQFKALYPGENFGACWQKVDKHVRNYPGLFSEGEEDERLEGVAINRGATGELDVPDVTTDAGRGKIRRTLEALVERMEEDGNKHVAQRPAGKA